MIIGDYWGALHIAIHNNVAMMYFQSLTVPSVLF
jgi:hypothetical protein